MLARKPLRTYSRQRNPSLSNQEPPAKRRRVDTSETRITSIEICNDGGERSSSAERGSSPICTRSTIATSSPTQSEPLFSDAPMKSTPPSSPVREPQSQSLGSRRPAFSFLRRTKISRIQRKEPLSERSNNVPPAAPFIPKKKRLVQMQLDLVTEMRKTCKICGMEYIPSNMEDATVHRKFHAMSIGGIDLSRALVERIKQNQLWAGGSGSFVAVVGRKDAMALRNKAIEVLKVVNTELGAAPMPDEALWGQVDVKLLKNTQARGGTSKSDMAENQMGATSDRYKVYLYVRGQKCVGACLAERIQEAYTVLDRDDASEEASQVPANTESSSISVSDTTAPAILGISRIWASNLHRKHGIATQLLDSACSDFLYGMTVEKPMVAFSQPTESGGRLARKWFGRRAGWLVYVD